MATANKPKSTEDRLRLLLMIAACFAIGSIGILMAVLMQSNATNSNGTNMKITTLQPVLTQQDKEAILASLHSNADGSTDGSALSSPAAPDVATSTLVSNGQVDANDRHALDKMKILESLK